MRGVNQQRRAGRITLLLFAALAFSGVRGADAPVDDAKAAFENLPEAKHQQLGENGPRRGSVNEGTSGLQLSGATINGQAGAETIAILGDLAPTNEFSGKYLAEAASEMNLLRPDAVFTVGNLVPGLTRSGQTYAKEVSDVRSVLDGLKMPWYPCAGGDEVISGTRDVADRRFEALYQKYFGPLYYSVNIGAVHVIVLDSEEGLGKGNQISDPQLAWLKTDLNRTFEARRTRSVLVIVHRPLWREEDKGGNWGRVHEMLADFNRRPIVSVEGVDIGGDRESGSDGPRVVGVYAGSTRGYSQEPTRDGIHYTVLGATAARIDQDASEMIRGFALVHFDASSGGVHGAVVKLAGRLGADAGGAIVADDVITSRERSVLDDIAALPNETMGVEGVLQQTGGTVTLHAENPLRVPLDMEIRLASTKNYSDQTSQENVNPFAESLDAPWELTSSHLIRHLDPGAKEKWDIGFSNENGSKEIPPPQLEFVIHWADPSGRMHTVVLKRKVPVAYTAEIPAISGVVGAKAAFAGDHSASGGLYVWQLHGDEPREKGATWDMAADDENVYVRVRIQTSIKNTIPSPNMDWKWGGLAAEAVTVSWLDSDGKVQRVWAIPFGPNGLQLLINQGTGDAQSPLTPLDEKTGVRGEMTADDKSSTVMLTLPRKLIMAAEQSVRINIGLNENQGGARTWKRSWNAGGQVKGAESGWGTISIATPKN